MLDDMEYSDSGAGGRADISNGIRSSIKNLGIQDTF
jgi:hypothetical protein